MGRTSAHRKATLENMATALFRYGRIRTTEAKAKALRPYVEPLITRAKTDTLANRRRILRSIRDKEIMRKLFEEIGPLASERPGGYTRIIKTANRPGDGAPMAYIELVDRPVEEEPEEEAPKKGLLSRVLQGSSE